MKENIMSEEAFDELINGFEYVGNLTEYGRKNIKYHVQKLKQENKQLKAELKNKPDTEITLQDDKGNKFTIIQTERIDMQERLNKTIQRLLNNWDKLKEYIDIKLYNTEYLQRLCGCKIDDETHMTLDIIKKEMHELEQESDENE